MSSATRDVRTADEYSLRLWCTELGISGAGNAAVLRNRIRKHLQNNNSSDTVEYVGLMASPLSVTSSSTATAAARSSGAHLFNPAPSYTSSSESTKTIFFDHDGGIDDYMALLMLCDRSVCNLIGVSVTPADCFIDPAVSVTRKLLGLCGITDVPVGKGSLDGVHPFPTAWRMDAYKLDSMPVINQPNLPLAPFSKLTGEELMAQKIMESSVPVTLVMTGPLTNLAWVLKNYPSAESNIAELIWMGGAVDVTGNVRESPHDGSAEWNVYWDAPSAKIVFDSSIKIRLFSLDATNHVPVTPEFVNRFGGQWNYPLSNFAGNAWAQTVYWSVCNPTEAYYAWDALTAAYILDPLICDFELRNVVLDVAEPSEGRTRPVRNLNEKGSREVLVAKNVNVPGFYQLCLDSFRR